MAPAKSLADLMKIRALPKNRKYLDSINGSLGTALGFKRRTGEATSSEPAIIVFVPEKIHRKWLPATTLIKPSLSHPDGLKCPLDVVTGGKALQEDFVPDSGTALAQRLRGWDERIWCGSQITSAIASGISIGTLGVFARASDGTSGFITNEHVAVNTTLWHPWAPGSQGFSAGTRRIGRREKTILEVPVADWYGDFAREDGNANAAVRVDAAFVALDLVSIKPEEISPQPLVDPFVSDALPSAPVGPALEIDLEADMSDPVKGIVGRKVFHVGRTTGLRKGEVAAFAYEWKDQPGQTRYTDLLIKGETRTLAAGVEASYPFSSKGDSGTVVFMHKQGKHHPVGLLWGGWQEQLRGGESQENWSYATGMHRLLDELDLQLITKTSEIT